MPSSGGSSPVSQESCKAVTRPCPLVVTPAHSPMGARPAQVPLLSQESPPVASNRASRTSLSVSGEVWDGAIMALGSGIRRGQSGISGVAVAKPAALPKTLLRVGSGVAPAREDSRSVSRSSLESLPESPPSPPPQATRSRTAKSIAPARQGFSEGRVLSNW